MNHSSIGRLALITVSMLSALLLIEVGFRIALPAKKASFARSFIMADPATGQTIHKPNQDIVIFSGETQKNARIITNSEGFIGKDYKVEKPKNTLRIAVLGDSYVAALQVDTEKNFVSLLEKKLNEKSATRYEVMNFGIGGQGTMEELQRYHSYVKKYKPDYVFVIFYPNDFENNQYYLEHESRIINHEPIWDIPPSEANNLKGRTGWKPWLMENSYAVPFIEARVRQNALLSKIAISVGLLDQGVLGAPKGSIHPTFFIFKKPIDTTVKKVFDFSVDLFSYFNLYARENGAELFVVYLPQADQVDATVWQTKQNKVPELANYTWDLDQPNNYFTTKFTEKDIVFLDLTPKFKKYYENNTTTFLYNERTEHFNETGHEIMADELSSFVKALP